MAGTRRSYLGEIETAMERDRRHLGQWWTAAVGWLIDGNLRWDQDDLLDGWNALFPDNDGHEVALLISWLEEHR